MHKSDPDPLHLVPRTSYLVPRTSIFKLQTSNLKLQTSNLKPHPRGPDSCCVGEQTIYLDKRSAPGRRRPAVGGAFVFGPGHPVKEAFVWQTTTNYSSWRSKSGWIVFGAARRR